MRPEKTTIVDDLSARLNQSPFLIVTEYAGMNVTNFSELRIRLAGAGAQCKVVKTRSCAEPRQKWVILILPPASMVKLPL